MASMAASNSSPSNWPELISAAVLGERARLDVGQAAVERLDDRMDAQAVLRANSKSRSSCAGTAITAPSP